MANISNNPKPITWKKTISKFNKQKKLTPTEALTAISSFLKPGSGTHLFRTPRNIENLKTILNKAPKTSDQKEISIPPALVAQLKSTESAPDFIYDFLNSHIHKFNKTSQTTIKELHNNHMKDVISKVDLNTDTGKQRLIQLIDNLISSSNKPITRKESIAKYNIIDNLISKLEKNKPDFDILKTLFKNIDKFIDGHKYIKDESTFPKYGGHLVDSYLLNSLEKLIKLPNSQQNNQSKEFALELILEMCSKTYDYDIPFSTKSLLTQLKPINTKEFILLLDRYLTNNNRKLDPNTIITKWIKTNFEWLKTHDEFKDILIDEIPPPTSSSSNESRDYIPRTFIT